MSRVEAQLRRVALPGDVPGALYLASMPGRYESFATAEAAIVGARIGRVVCLTPMEEVRQKAPEYAERLAGGALPWTPVHFPVRDYGAPEDRDGFRALAGEVADAVRTGEYVLIHCAGGIGRTGMLAWSVLVLLGVAIEAAGVLVAAAGSRPEAAAQRALVEWVARNAGAR